MAGGKTSTYEARAFLDIPALSILRSDGDVTLSWPIGLTDLCCNKSRPSGHEQMVQCQLSLTTNGVTKSATVPLTPTNQFFRLKGN